MMLIYDAIHRILSAHRLFCVQYIHGRMIFSDIRFSVNKHLERKITRYFLPGTIKLYQNCVLDEDIFKIWNMHKIFLRFTKFSCLVTPFVLIFIHQHTFLIKIFPSDTIILSKVYCKIVILFDLKLVSMIYN